MSVRGDFKLPEFSPLEGLEPSDASYFTGTVPLVSKDLDTGQPPASNETPDEDRLTGAMIVDTSTFTGSYPDTEMHSPHKMLYSESNGHDDMENVILAGKETLLTGFNSRRAEKRFAESRLALEESSRTLTRYLSDYEQLLKGKPMYAQAVTDSIEQTEANIAYVKQHYVRNGRKSNLNAALEVISGCISAARTFRNIG